MNREIQMKQKVLDMLKEFMMGEEGSKFKPKAIEVEMIGKPTKEGLKDVLEDAAEANPVEDEDCEDEAYEESALDRMADKAGAEEMGESEKDYEDSETDEERDAKAKKMTLSEFLASRK